MITGILIPNIEFVLGLVGSTIGVMICLIFPAIFFISISSKHTNERLLAQIILFIGICIMILSTYANLYALEESTNTKILTPTNKPSNQINGLPLNLNKDDINANFPNNPKILPNIKEEMNKLPDLNVIKNSLNLQVNDIRQEPPIPVERIIITEKPMIETQKSVDNILVTFAPVIKKNLDKLKAIDTSFDKQLNNLVKNDITTIESVIENKKVSNLMKIKKNFISTKKQDNLINFDAIKKEESELAAYIEAVNMLPVERHEKLRKTSEKTHKQEIERQKQKIIQAKQEHKNDEDKSKTLNEKSIMMELNKNSTIITNSFKKESLQKENTDDKILDLVLSNNNKDLYKRKDIDMNYTLLDNKLNNEKIKEISSNNSKELRKGPILNALTKRVLQRSISINDSKLNDKTEPDKIMHNNKDNSSDMIPNSREKNEYFLPIALKMRNQTKVENTLNPIEHKSDKDVQIIHRDILENHEREKREINIEIEETSTKVTSDISNKKSDNLIKNFIKDNEKCCKRKKKLEKNLTSKLSEKISQNSSKSNTIEISLIKTNVYLSDQKLENTLSIDSNISIREEYIKLKQRDLKFVNTGEDYI